MIRAVFILILLSFQLGLKAQFGITIKQNFNSFPVWEQRASAALNNNVDIFPFGQEYGFDYWLRLKNKRVEFLPQLAVSRFSTDLTGSAFLDGYILTRAHFNFNTNLYLLDFANDCDCPTFSKQGNFLTKGLFLQLSPGLVYHRQLINYLVTDPEFDLKTNLSYKLGFGLGLDIGITDLFTITPMVGINFYPSVNWESFDLLHFDATIASPTENKTSIREIQFGVRIGFRPDYKTSYY